MRRAKKPEMRCKQTTRERAAQAGFTLIEIMIALAILGSSLFILLDMHYNAVHIQDRLEFEVKIRNLLAQAAGIAEVEIAAGTLKDSQEFGDRYPGFRYTFDAELVDGSTSTNASSNKNGALSAYPGLYDVLVTVEDPDKVAHELHFYVMSRDMQAILGEQATGEAAAEGEGGESPAAPPGGTGG